VEYTSEVFTDNNLLEVENGFGDKKFVINKSGDIKILDFGQMSFAYNM
jgi:hypothetical protein